MFIDVGEGASPVMQNQFIPISKRPGCPTSAPRPRITNSPLENPSYNNDSEIYIISALYSVSEKSELLPLSLLSLG
jgi:hypothetical protein